MALIERGTGENVQQDNNLSVKVNLELPKKGSFTSLDSAGSIALKPNNLLSYKGNDDITYEIPLGGGVSNLQGVLTVGNSATKAIQLKSNTDDSPTASLPANKGFWFESRDYDGGVGGSLRLINPYGVDESTGRSISMQMQINDSTVPDALFNFAIGGGNIQFRDPESASSLGIVAEFSDRVKGIPAVNPDEFVTKSQLDSSSGTLQSVTNGSGNNVTNNAIQFTGINNLNTSIDSLSVFGGVGETGFINIIAGEGTGALGFKPAESRFVFQTSSAPGDTTVFLLRTEDGSTSGANVNRRLSFEPAVNGNEGVTLSQLNAAIPSLSGYELLSNKSTNTSLGTSNSLYPTQNAVKSYIDTGLGLKANLSTNTFTGNQIVNASVGINVTPTSPLHVKGVHKIERTITSQYIQIDAEGGSMNFLAKNTSDGSYGLIIFTQGNNTLNREVLRFDTVGNTLIAGKATITGAPVNPTDVPRKLELDLKANLASPSLTGTPLAPTAAAGTNTTQIATTAYVFTNYTVKSIESSATTAQTSATLNASYPSVASGQVVVAPLVGTGMGFIKKSDGNWMSFVGSNI